ncbi:efflux RND transporter periplasmic adaptor subunit [Vagococcus vulneris]|uniref:YknX-like beta-barrel domain-containing protein n=1 Tax=Vagococcus vulneris TaxID=1977869 RepID=A0A429ZWN3_9ENTE|nr:efflux RND transporter periplasmic adaptor subunit [Vagococcus vulneris]RST98198.1 hypothetical protein CBF37_08495 [Vagococcus vulneris]
MKKKSKVLIGSGIFLAVIASGITIFSMRSAPEPAVPENKIEFYTVKDIDQVFINGVVTPVQSKEFTKDTTLGKLGELKVKNGDYVEEGTLLYQYVDDATSTQITDLKYQIESTQAEKEKAARQMNLKIKELTSGQAAAPTGLKESEAGVETEASPAATRESIELEYDLNSFDMKMNQLQAQINELTNKQVNQVTAPFAGEVSIPQEQNRDSAILTLTSTDFYVQGQVNERDLVKIKEKQPADVKTIAGDKLYKGEIVYIANTPASNAQGAGDAGGGAGGAASQGGSMSNYIVKLTIKDGKDIKEGYHVQASIKLNDEKIEVPKEVVKTENGKSYVLVDDFGTVLRKEITTTDEGATRGKIVVTSGLESLDKVIMSSDKPVKEGDMIDSPGDVMDSSMSGEAK